MEKELTEGQTRKEKIDVILNESGWEVKDRTKVVLEVDTKQSDFKTRNYKTVSETLRSDEKSAYADYLLLDSFGEALAIIEAKRTAKDPILGQKQAEGYADDIKKQTGKDIFIFLSNGYDIWFWNRPYKNPRMVKGFHSKDALERIRFQNYSKKKFFEAPLKSEIIDRPYQIEAAKRVLEGIEKGKRKFLIVMATGTGKTRVSMALIDVLLCTNHAQKILFLADRKALRDQAFSDGFKVFFPHESKTKVFSGALEKTSRLFASTIQTFMECYQEFSVGDFDVIISDKCHMSIYVKWKDVFTYFDAVEIGLTATPSEWVERDTFRFFECEDRIPTTLYSYDQAVDEGWLAPFQIYKAQTHYQIAGIKPEDVPRAVMRELMEKGIEPEEVNFEGTDIEKKVVVTGTNEAIVKEFMENCLRDMIGTLPAKTIFFAITKKHAKRLWEAFEKLYPEYKGNLARIVVSDDPKAQDIINDFKKETWPRIAISVDMLDTGVDIPEVCNLVFAKPVFSKIKFWQMIGRGSRNDAACKHKEWLPNGKKEEYLIFDCWKVFDWHDIHPEGREVKPIQALPAKIFLIRIRLLDHFLKIGDQKRADDMKKKLLNDIKSLPKKSVSIREHLRDVELASSPKLWNRVGLDPVDFLRKRLAPLMKYKPDVEINQASFTLKMEQLSLGLLTENRPEIERLREEIGEVLNCLPTTLKVVRQKQASLDKVLTKSFWQKITYESAQMMLKEFGPLMRYKLSKPRPKIILDIDDVVERREIIQYGPPLAALSDYVYDYRAKVERKIKRLAEEHPTIQKIKRDEIITEEDLQRLEKTLNSPDLYITEEALQKIYKQHKGTLVQFIKKILGLYEFPEPKQKIEEAFKTFMIEKNYLKADQVNFLRTVQTVFLLKHHVEYRDLFEPPFTSFGSKAPLLLDQNDLKEVFSMCQKLEKEVFVNA